ncbi:formimidoylglutamate deiminase [Stappia sp. F7233]|uniref:Formimidoylglutamate deiminase n=1 Tax=Stappia albiluteola TaxID=2758565 RepID=A0A839ABX5_9HYPH|nr:formimidoylglutamate deiminase [Stappia albiluteola]MBA5777210.1 formimidoylglutamate deiminase [Stappia albiluteola]
MTTRLHADHVLLPTGWARNMLVEIGADGRIASVSSVSEKFDASGIYKVGVLLPAPGNVHSHAFQRAMAGLAERRSRAARDSFWTWREVMYRFLDRLSPDQVQAIAAQVQVEMLEAGYAAVGEFHYLHNAPSGTPYGNPAELSLRIMAAAAETGIGLTHLPVLYTQGGVDGRPLAGGQKRFEMGLDDFDALLGLCREAIGGLPGDARLGAAPHSLRAVTRDELAAVCGLLPDGPVHIHAAEQVAEIEAVTTAYGLRPVEFLLANYPVDGRWCLIHATHMTEGETEGLARRKAVAGLCPITEGNLGDGIFNGRRFLQAGGSFAIGSDSNVLIALPEELRQLEYSQRLNERSRAVLASPGRSCGRTLYEGAAKGSAQALFRHAGEIAPGRLADLVALDGESLALDGLVGDALLDAFVFASPAHLVSDVWSAGRHMVRGGRHVKREAIEARYRKAVAELREAL